MKDLFLTTGLGSWALELRSRYGLVRNALGNLEELGAAANDTLAGHLIAAICRPKATFVDVGAHIGSVLSEVHRQDPSVRVIAFEAIAEKADKLRSNFPFATVHACAVGAEEKEEISFFVDLEHSGYSSLSSNSRSGGRLQEIKTAQRTLDLVLSDIRDLDVIKIDVEGAELQALQGGRHLIHRSQPLIMFESVLPGENELGNKPEDVFDFFSGEGFELFVPNRLAHDGPGLSRDGYVEAHHYPRRTSNFFAVHRDRRIEFRDRARRILGVIPESATET